jgi:hypothetical protein
VSEPPTATLTEGERKFLHRVEGKALDMFGSIDIEHMFRTFRAIKALGYSIVEFRDAKELFSRRSHE